MNIPVKIIVEDDDHESCGRNCPFLSFNECLLFRTELEETRLKAGFVWQDGVAPTMWRCDRCTSMEAFNE